MLSKLLKAIALFALIPGTLVWITGIAALLFRLLTWHETGQWTKSAIINFLPNSFMGEINGKFPMIHKEIFWVINREIVLLFLGIGVFQFLIYLILNVIENRRAEKAKIVVNKQFVANRLNNLTQYK